ncbi:(5-formylfuran-3-yl)methyl phosphate synthase [Bremerella sp. T1]|uniref:(5-formylfuran-3-yl)methyl phosphate synthase n=1 Tax=Bremerella sp. TYQ1 TaxID=3119568 RepID=UPI001CCB1B01|nr:(5-formylfuran-3-yl)methyl phosphate synthase [Bremerella volcania]UBM37586.1 (5-formylfuran-3-yl)methyl phosphate synthase [Bremerella volcania]
MQWLVSVRNRQEADLVMPYGVDRLDLKEPTKGSLGAASPEDWKETVERWHRQVPVSIALGELVELDALCDIPHHTDSVKIGLANCGSLADWPERLNQFFQQLPDNVGRVAVYYADRHLACSPSFNEVLHAACRLNCQTFLIDTFDKSAGHLFDHLSITQLKEWRNQLNLAGLHFALAGSLRTSHLSAVGEICPDIVAVRGAVCHHDRRGEISAEALNDFHDRWKRVSTCKQRRVVSPG